MSTSNKTIGEFLDALASGQPTPGGGGAAALTGSQAAALLSMVINFTVGRKKYAAVEDEMRALLERTETLRTALVAMVDDDAAAFNAVAATYSMPKDTPEEQAARTEAMQAGLKQATEVPYRVAEHCLEILEHAGTVGAKGNANVVSDAATAIYLAGAALHSAVANVNINLKYIKDEAFVATWTQKRNTLLESAAATYRTSLAACAETLGVEL